MSLNILSVVKDIFEPLTKMVDDVHTSSEEKLAAKNELVKLENQITSQLIELKTKELEAQSSIIIAEAKGESWLQRNWRPTVMLAFTFTFMTYWFGWAAQDVPKEVIETFLDLVKIGLGGYVVGRSAEKVADKVVTGMKSKSSS